MSLVSSQEAKSAGVSNAGRAGVIKFPRTAMQLPNGFSATQIARCISSKRLELTILPTEKCNFRCTYCYEDFAIGRMKQGTIQGLKRLIDSRAQDLKELSISWFGGEPLLALAVIYEIAEHGKNLSEKHGFSFDGGLTTNAYLLKPDVLAKLVALNQNFYQITLDGWGSRHDETRKLANGRGTFGVIWKNLLAAKQTDLKFEAVLRIHLTHTNQSALEELMLNIHRELSADSRFRLDFQDVRDLGGDGGESVIAVDASDFHARVQKLKSIAATGDQPPVNVPSQEVVKRTGESAAGRRAYEIEKNEPYICYASKPNHLLIRADGRVGKCTVALDHPANTIGHLASDGTVQIDQELARHWFGGLDSFSVEQMGCPLPFAITAHKQSTEQKAIPLQLA